MGEREKEIQNVQSEQLETVIEAPASIIAVKLVTAPLSCTTAPAYAWRVVEEETDPYMESAPATFKVEPEIEPYREVVEPEKVLIVASAILVLMRSVPLELKEQPIAMSL
jgi:hypothetical protein